MNYCRLLFLLLIVPVHPVSSVSPASFLNEDQSMVMSCPQESPSAQMSSGQKSHISKRDQKDLLRAERRIERLHKYKASKRGQKLLGGINDPVDKWFWFWIIGWGTGLLLSILTGGALAGGGIGIIWFSLFVLGSISLIIWLLKKFR